ncbi:MAG TPA: hypothetical protein VMB26_16250 [Candidatus Binataceae bacterium]|nr:hypothetical protein [Candidatus Binataceae bacterium]
MLVLAVSCSYVSAADLSETTSPAGIWGTRESQFYTPQRFQLDLELNNVSDFVTDNSLIRRREASIAGSAFHWGPDLGVSTMQQPGIKGTFWFDGINAVQLQFSYFALYGSSFLTSPATFNGDVLAPGQNISTSGTTWFSVGLFYQRRITPWLDQYTGNLPDLLRHWDVRPLVGLEFVYLDFKINNGHPRLISGNLDAEGRWNDQELPVPTIGVELQRRLAEHFALQISAQGNWINKWNSLRSEGGTVYLSQSGFQTHWRIYYLDAALMGLRPFLGMVYYYFRQAETSSEIGNLARMQAFGPEVGLNFSFNL